MKTLDLSAVRTAALAILLALLPIAVNAQTTPPPPTVSWTQYGVSPTGSMDTGDDSADALNGLPADVGLIGDCPANQPYIRITKPWKLKNNLTIYVKKPNPEEPHPGCRVVCDWPTGGQSEGCITQQTFSNALADTLHDIYIDGLYVFNKNQTTFKGKALKFAANHLTMTNVTADGFHAFAYVRGGDQEWSGAFINSPSRGDINNPGDGFRHLGNMMNPAGTTGGKPANVWVHDFTTTGQSDGALQVAPSCVLYPPPNGTPKPWNNDSANDYLYENSNLVGDPGSMILVGYPGGVDESGGAGVKCTNSHITNIVVRNITGSSTGTAVIVYAAGQSLSPTQCVSCSIEGVTIENVTIDQSNRPPFTPPGMPTPPGTPGVAFSVRGADLTPISDVTLRNISVTNTADTCFDVSGLPMSGIVLDQIVCDSPRYAGTPNATIRATTGVTIKNSTIGSKGAAALEIGPRKNLGGGQMRRVNGGDYNVQNVVLDNNHFTGVTDGQSGVLFRNSANGSMTNSTVTEAAGQTDTTGVRFFSSVANGNPGAWYNTVTGNDLTGVDTGVYCAPSQGNVVTGNTGNIPPC